MTEIKNKISEYSERIWKMDKLWKWYLIFAFGAGFFFTILGMIEFVVLPDMMAEDVPEGLFDMITGCLVLLATMFVFIAREPKLPALLKSVN